MRTAPKLLVLRHNVAVPTTRLPQLPIIVIAAIALALPTAAAAEPPTPTRGISLTQDTIARKSPSADAKAVARVPALTPLTGQRMVLPGIGRRKTESGDWIRVSLGIRPNGSTGWVPAKAGRLVPLDWSIRVDLARRQLVVRHNWRVVKRITIVVGAESTPSPTGRFFVVEHVRLGTSWSPNGWALALSAFSNILRHYDGGEGQVALHARGTLRGALGSASSHGCVRLPDAIAAWLARWIPNGTPVRIF